MKKIVFLMVLMMSMLALTSCGILEPGGSDDDVFTNPETEVAMDRFKILESNLPENSADGYSIYVLEKPQEHSGNTTYRRFYIKGDPSAPEAFGNSYITYDASGTIISNEIWYENPLREFQVESASEYIANRGPFEVEMYGDEGREYIPITDDVSSYTMVDVYGERYTWPHHHQPDATDLIFQGLDEFAYNSADYDFFYESIDDGATINYIDVGNYTAGDAARGWTFTTLTPLDNLLVYKKIN